MYFPSGTGTDVEAGSGVCVGVDSGASTGVQAESARANKTDTIRKCFMDFIEISKVWVQIGNYGNFALIVNLF